MAVNLKGRSFLKELDFTSYEWNYLLKLSANLKNAKRAGTEQRRMIGKNVALIFEKTSTRTRCAFEVGAYDQGAGVTYLEPSGSQMGHKESIKDTARVLGRMYDGIEYRGFSQEIVEELAKYAGVPVWNGLTDEFHPTQMLADQLTMIEYLDGRPLHNAALTYVGDGRNNVANSILISSAMMGVDLRIGAPKAFFPEQKLIDQANVIAKSTGAKITITEDVKAAVKGTDFIYTDIWVSMGEPAEKWEERINILKPYQVNADLMKATGNPHTKFLHCLPAYNNRQTKIGEELFQKYGLVGAEVTEEVFESSASVVFDQAENRMHTIKAVMVATIGH